VLPTLKTLTPAEGEHCPICCRIITLVTALLIIADRVVATARLVVAEKTALLIIADRLVAAARLVITVQLDNHVLLSWQHSSDI